MNNKFILVFVSMLIVLTLSFLMSNNVFSINNSSINDSLTNNDINNILTITLEKENSVLLKSITSNEIIPNLPITWLLEIYKNKKPYFISYNTPKINKEEATINYLDKWKKIILLKTNYTEEYKNILLKENIPSENIILIQPKENIEYNITTKNNVTELNGIIKSLKQKLNITIKGSYNNKNLLINENKKLELNLEEKSYNNTPAKLKIKKIIKITNTEKNKENNTENLSFFEIKLPIEKNSKNIKIIYDGKTTNKKSIKIKIKPQETKKIIVEYTLPIRITKEEETLSLKDYIKKTLLLEKNIDAKISINNNNVVQTYYIKNEKDIDSLPEEKIKVELLTIKLPEELYEEYKNEKIIITTKEEKTNSKKEFFNKKIILLKNYDKKTNIKQIEQTTSENDENKILLKKDITIHLDQQNNNEQLLENKKQSENSIKEIKIEEEKKLLLKKDRRLAYTKVTLKNPYEENYYNITIKINYTENKEDYIPKIILEEHNKKIIINNKNEYAIKINTIKDKNNNTIKTITLTIPKIEKNSEIKIYLQKDNKKTNIKEKTITTEEGNYKIESEKGNLEEVKLQKDKLYFKITNLEKGEKTKVKITLPYTIPKDVTFYFEKNINEKRIKIPYNLNSERNEITITLQDGKTDEDGIENGIIVDPLLLKKPNFNVTIQTKKVLGKTKKATLTIEDQIENSLSQIQPTKIQKINQNNINTNNLNQTLPLFLQNKKTKKIDLEIKKGNLENITIVDPTTIINTPIKPERFEYKLLKFRITNVTNSEDIFITVDKGTNYIDLWKYNPNQDYWYKYPFEIVNETTIKITLYDGGLGDDDGIKNNIIEDDLGITYNWWNFSFPWRTAFNVTNSKTTTLINYTLQIELNSTNFNFTKADVNGSDLRITYYNTTTDSETLLPLYIEYYNATEEKAYIWTKANLTSGTQTLFLYYGNSTVNNVSNISLFPGTTKNAILVWHFDEGSGTTAYDSSGSGNNGTIYGANYNSTCVFGSCINLTDTGTTDYVQLYPFNDHPDNAITVSYWLYSNDNTNTGTAYSYATSNDNNEFLLYNYNSLTVYRATTNRATNLDYADGIWHNIVVTWNQSDGALNVYEDGVNVYTGSFSAGTPIVTGGSLMLGQEQDSVGGTLDAAQSVIGYMDEVVVLNTNVSAEVASLFSKYYPYTSIYLNDTILFTTKSNPEPTITFAGSEYSNVLNTTIDLPKNSTQLIRTQPFTMNGTVQCLRGNCSTVNSYYEYYATSTPENFWIKDTVDEWKNYSSIQNVTFNSKGISISPGKDPEWWNLTFQKRMQINLTSTENLNDYQYILHLNSTNTGSNFPWNDNKTIRIVYYDNTTETQTELPFYIGYWNETAQDALIAVKLNITTGDNQLFIYYDNNTIVPSVSTTSIFEDVIDKAILVWHLDEGSGTTAKDSSGYGNDGTVVGATWSNSCKYDGCIDLTVTDTSDYIILNPFNHPQNNVTVLYWLNSNDNTNTGTVYSYASSSDSNEFLLYNYNSLTVYRAANFRAVGLDSTDGNWNSVVATWDGATGDLRVYTNGALYNQNTLAGGTTIVTGGSLVIGQEQDSVGGTFSASQSAIGLVDEVVVINDSISDAKAKLLSQYYPQTFNTSKGIIYLRKKTNNEPTQTNGIEETLNRKPSAEYISSVYDTESSETIYTNITWQQENNSNTDITIYTRTSTGQTTTWWDPAWFYKTNYTIQNTGSVDTGNVTIQLLINASQLNDTGELKNNCEDIRFITQDPNTLEYTKLNYYQDGQCNFTGGYTRFLVEMTNIPANSQRDIWVYYGNPNANSESTTTFLDFYDGIESFNGWTTYGNGLVSQDSTRSYTGGFSAHKTTNNDPNGAYKDIGTTLGRGIVLEGWINRNAAYTGGAADRVGLIDNSGNGYGFVYTHGTTNSMGIDQRDAYTGTVNNYVAATDIRDDWYFFRFIIPSTGSIISQYYLRNGTNEVNTTYTDTTYNSFTRVYIFGGNDYWVDDLRIYKYNENVSIVGQGSITNYSTESSDVNLFVWSNWYQAVNNSAPQSPNARYIQFKAILTSTTNETPILDKVSIAYKKPTGSWIQMQTSGTSFTTNSPYACGIVDSTANCTPTLSVTPLEVGTYYLRLHSISSDANIEESYSSENTVEVWMQPTLTEYNVNKSVEAVGKDLLFTIRLLDDLGQPLQNRNITFKDLTGNGSTITIGSNLTDSNGYAKIKYTLPLDLILGTHTINIKYNGSTEEYILPVEQNNTFRVSSQPVLENITVNPNPAGFGYNITIDADANDQVGLDTVEIKIQYENGTVITKTMQNVNGNTYEYNFTDTWHVEKYNYTIKANNTDGIETLKTGNFSVEVYTETNYTTQKDIYKNNEIVYLNDTIVNSYYQNYSDWKYRKKITLGGTNTELTNYSLEINLDNTNFEFSLANYTGKDLRFTYYNTTTQKEEEIPYWIEDYNNTTEKATVWVKLPYINSSGATIYLYYGNENANSESNGTATFLFYDDFENFVGWTTYGSGDVVQDNTRAYKGTFSGHKITNNDPNGAYKDIGTTLGTDIILEAWVNRNAAYTGGGYDRIGVIDNSGNGYGWVFGHGTPVLGYDVRSSYTGTASTTSNSPDIMDEWQFARLIIKSDGTIQVERYNLSKSLLGTYSGTDTTYNSFTRVYIFGGNDYWVDEMRVRKYYSSEISKTFGNLELIQPGLRNKGNTTFKGYLRMLIQQYDETNNVWNNILPPVIDQQYHIINSYSTLNLTDLWKTAGGYNLTDKSPGTYRVYTVLEDPNRNTLIDSYGNKIEGYYNFTIIQPTLVLTNLTYENNYTYNISEYETTDRIDWINVTIKPINNTAYNTNITLSLLDSSYNYVNFGPLNETKDCGNLSENEECQRMYDNLTNGYYIPKDASTGIYTFYWNVVMDTSNGQEQTNRTLNFKILNIPSTISTVLNETRIYKPNSTIYNYTFKNLWSKNITNINLTINCPNINGLNCTSINSGTKTEIISELANNTSITVQFNISANESVPSDNYNINVTLNYTNPAGETKSWKETGNQILEVRLKGILAITDYYHPLNVTRNKGSYDLKAYMNNTGDLPTTNAWLNYTLPSGWSVTAGNQNQLYATLNSNEIGWNNITTTLDINSQLGSQKIRLDSGSDDGLNDFKEYYIDVYADPVIIGGTNATYIDRGETIEITAKLTYDNGTILTGQNITFKDETENYIIGSNLTDSNGIAKVYYYINNTSTLGLHTINLTYDGDTNLYLNPQQNTTTIDVHEKPSITITQIQPNITGYNQKIHIEAEITDADDIAQANITITKPNGQSITEQMSLTPPSTYTYDYTNTDLLGIYNITITAIDTLGSTSIEKNNFTIKSNLTPLIKTDKKEYSQNENVYLTPGTINYWEYTNFDKRINFTINNPNSNLEEYNIYIEYNFSQEYLNNSIRNDCNDVRFTYYNTTTQKEEKLPYTKVYCNLTEDDNASFWIKTNLTNGDNTIYLYYGNENANDESNETKVFTYNKQKLVGYVSSQTIVNNGLRIMSYYDNNNVTVGTTNQILNKYDTLTVTTGLSINTPIYSTKPIQAEGIGNVDDMIVPKSWAATEFVYGGMRDAADEFCMISPYGSSTVTIYDGGTAEWTGTVDSVGTCITNDITSGNAARITSTLPLLVFRDGTNGQDSWPFYPATKILYHPSVSNYLYGATVTAANTKYYSNTGASGPTTITANSEYNYGNVIPTGNSGLGDAAKIISDQNIGVIQQADSDGTESTVAVPLKEFSRIHGSSLSAEYITAVTPYSNVTCELKTSTGTFATNTSTGTNGVYKICFNCGSSTSYITQPWTLECNKPVWMYYEEDTDGDETTTLGAPQIRESLQNEPTITTTKTEDKPSIIINHDTFNHTVYLIAKIQYNNSGTWQDVTTIIDDVTNNNPRNITSTGIDISQLWNSTPWNTTTSNPGIYRAYLMITDNQSNILNNTDNTKLEAESIFTIKEPPVNVNITSLRIYDVTNALESNWHSYINDYIGEGLNQTWTLTKDNIYRIEIDVENIGSTDWNLTETTTNYFNLNSSWDINVTRDIWYSNETLLDNKRTDTNYEGGTFDGTITWNTTKGGIIKPGDNATFFIIINLTSQEDRTIQFKTNSTTFSKEDYSTLHILQIDNTPPKLYVDNSIEVYNLSRQNITRGESFDAYARWTETISEANVSYTTTSNSLYVTDTNSSPQNAQNWTNFTITSTSTWYLGNHSVKITAKDESGNVNDTLQYLNITVYGIATINSMTVNNTTPLNGTTIEIKCNIQDSTNNSIIENYNVEFYNSTALLGTNTTNSSGDAIYYYTDNTPGTETLKCKINEDLTNYYVIDQNNQTTITITTTENEPPYYTTYQTPTIAHKGDTIQINVSWYDNYNLSNAWLEQNSSGTKVNETPITITGTQAWANISYTIPTTMKPGILEVKQYANDSFNNLNNTTPRTIQIWGYSEVASANANPSSVQTNQNTTLTCLIQDTNTTGISNYQVNFYYKGSADSTYTYYGTNNTDSNGYAYYDYNFTTSDTYTLLCNITDDTVKQYNVTINDNKTDTVNVVSGADATPPKIVLNNYTINDTTLYRGECLEISGLWDETINDSTVEYNLTPTSITTVTVPPPYTNNWTNYTLCTDSTWQPGNYTIRLTAKDEAGNINDTLDYYSFNVTIKAKLQYESPTGNVNRGVTTIICNVTAEDSGLGIENYTVTFYDGDLGYSLGSNDTDSNGKAYYTYDYSTINVGPDDISCEIQSKDYYEAISPTFITNTVYWYGTLQSNILVPENNSILHIGTTQSLIAQILDENGNYPKDQNGNDIILNANWYDNADNNIASGNETTWNIPTTYTLGPNNIKVNDTETYYYSTESIINVTIYSYSNITLIQPTTGTYPDNQELTIQCNVKDEVNGNNINNYPVEFYKNNTLIGTNTTNTNGEAYYTINTNTLNNGDNEILCLIKDNSTLYYNKSNSYNDSVIITVDSISPQISYNPNTDANGTYNKDYIFINVTATDSNLDKVTLVWNDTNTQTEETITNNLNDYYWINKTSLTDGTYYFYVYANDTANNTNQTDWRKIILDTSPPIVTITTPNNNSYHNINSIDLNVTTNENADSCWYNIDSGSNITLTAQNSTWYSDTITLTEGNHIINAYCNDTVNNIGKSNANITIDLTKPTVLLKAPNNNIYTNNTSIDFVCYIQDNFAIQNVSLYTNETSWSIKQTNTSGVNNDNYTFTETLTDGTYLWNCLAEDKAGNKDTNNTNYTITIDTKYPQLTIILPENKSYNTTTIDFNYTLIETNNDTCWYNLNDGSNITLPNCDNTTLSLTEGSYKLTLYANDTVGQTNNTIQYFTIDTTKPIITIDSPQNITYTTTNTIDLNYTLTETNPNECWYNLDGGTNITLTNCDNTTITTTNGAHNVTVYANDTAGNLNQTSLIFTIAVTNLIVTEENPTNNSYYNTTTIDLNATTNKAALECNYSLDSGSNVSMNNDSTTHWYATSPTLTEGQHTVKYYCTDGTENSENNLTYFNIDLTLPIPTIILPENKTYNTTTIDFNHTQTDNNGIDSCWYEYDNNGTVTLNNCENKTFTLTNGNHNITLYVQDVAGNINKTTQYFTIDTIPPTITIISPENKTYNTSVITLNITTNENVNSCWYEYLNTNTTMTQNNATNYYDTIILSDNTHYIQFYCNDTVNNTGTNNVTFTTDTTGPTINYVDPTPLDGGGTDQSWVYINTTMNEDVSNAILQWDYNNGTITNYTMSNNTLRNFYYNITGLTDGTYYYKVYANDTLNNTGETNIRTVIVSTTAPIITIHHPLNNEYYSNNIQDLNVTSNNEIVKYWYVYNGRTYNYTPNITITLQPGYNNITVYGTDILGRTGNSSIEFYHNGSNWNDTFTSYTGIINGSYVNITEKLYDKNDKTAQGVTINSCWSVLKNNTNIQSEKYDCWPYRKTITLSSSTTLTDYTAKIKLDLTTEYNAGKINNDCSDIRVTYEGTTEQEIPYWFKSCNNGNITLYTKVPSISSSTNINVYYGNKYATTTKNGTATFLFYDEFDTVDSSVWGTNAQYWNTRTENNNTVAYPTTSGTNTKITANYNYLSSYTTELWMRGNDSNAGATGYYSLGDDAGSKYLRLYLEPQNTRLNLYNGANNYYTINTTKEQHYTIKTDYTNNNYELYINDSSTAALSLTTTASGSNINPIFYSYYTEGIYLDTIAIRKYSSTEPTTTISTEETPIVNATLTSINIKPNPLFVWDKLYSDTNIPTGTSIIVKILDENNNSICGDITLSSGINVYDLYNNCPTTRNKNALKIYAELNTTNANKPIIYSWNITWKKLANILVESYTETNSYDSNSNINLSNTTNSYTNTSLLEQDIIVPELYNLTIKTTVTRGTVEANMINVNITSNETIKHQTINNYTTTVNNDNSTIVYTTPLIAINTSYNFSYTTLKLPKTDLNNINNNLNLNTIIHCTNYDINTNTCNSFEYNSTSDYNAVQNSTTITFNVTQFDAYLAGYNDINPPIFNDYNATPNPQNRGENVTFYVNVTDDYLIDTVLIELNGTNYTMTLQSGDVYYYELNTTDYTAGEYPYTIYANDTAGNINSTTSTFNVTENNVDLLILNITFSNYSASENDIVNVYVNVSNNGTTEAKNFKVELNVSLYEGTWTLNETQNSSLINLTAQNSTIITFTWTAKQGLYNFKAYADIGNAVTESNETNNEKNVNYSISSYQIYYGHYNYTKILGNNNNDLMKEWDIKDIQGNIYYSDYDSIYSFNDLQPLTGSDLQTADSALGMTYYNDSIKKLWDANNDNIPDATATFTIQGRTVANVPIINSTNNSNFITGILYDSADGATYDGSQDLIFITKLNYNKTGKYGTYDYEIRIPSNLKTLKPSTDLVQRIDEII